LLSSGHPAANRENFAQALNTWHAHHLQLEAGFLQMEENYQVRMSSELIDKFSRLKPVFDTLNRDFRTGLTAGFAPHGVSRILEKEAAYLQAMDTIVFSFDRE